MSLRLHFFKTIVFIFFISFSVKGQVLVSGIINQKSGLALNESTIKVFSQDSLYITGTKTDIDGNFNFYLPNKKEYYVIISFIGYKDVYKRISIEKDNINLGKITLLEDGKNLSEIEVNTIQKRGEQKGDTTLFNADAYKTQPDATAEDLIKKMPGFTSDNNGLKVNGETVQKVLVDGKRFFGDDQNAAIKNIPADIIDKVEVFDKMSDQSQFTGFNDGDQQKTINFVTKKGKNSGEFGKIYSGIGSDEDRLLRYSNGATINSFNDKRRISLLLLSNNINQQNFSMSDITGALGNSGQNSGVRQGGSGRQGNFSSGADNLMTSSQKGNTSTQASGLNYSDKWGKKTDISGSYFFNNTDNKNASDISRNYFTDNQLNYKQTNASENQNQNHRINLRIEYAIDSSNKITISPNFNFQNNTNKTNLLGNNTILDSIFLSKTQTNSVEKNIGYDFTNSFLYQHKFNKKGRSISLNIITQQNEKTNNGNYNSENKYQNDNLNLYLNQEYNKYGITKKISPNISYTEQILENSQILLSYNPSYTESSSNKQTFDSNYVTTNFSDFNTELSNKYAIIYETQRGGISYKYQKNKLNLSFGSDFQNSSLMGDQTFPLKFNLVKKFDNILPNAMLNYKIKKTKNLRMYYRSNTNIPDINQLQNVIDISNPLQIKSGNSELKQTFENNINIRFGGFDLITSRNVMLYINAGYFDNYISNATYILDQDTLIQNFNIKAGSQITKPINLNGFYNSRVSFTYGFPIKYIKCNFNLNTGLNYNHTPAMINELINYSDNFAYSGGLNLGSNLNKNIDFSISYNGNYTVVKNSIQKSANNNFFSHNANFKINWILFKNIVINSDFNHSLYSGLSQNFNQNYFLWNVYLGYKFLKSKNLEFKVSVYDLLNQNRSISRNVTGLYSEDNKTQVLKRYALVSLTYNFKKFKNGEPTKDLESDSNPFHRNRFQNSSPNQGGGN